MVINYVTGNSGKVKLANLIFKDLDVTIEQIKMDVPEIQSLDCEEVSKYSCKYACEKLNMPVLKNDSGIIFEALNGFPGALSKYAENTIGANGFIKLLKGKSRKCYWVEVLTYCEPNKEPISFKSYTYGTASEKAIDGFGYDYDKIFIPDGKTKTFSQMTENEWLNRFSNQAYIDLYNYLKK